MIQDPAGKNIGAATWTYNVADHALDFLAAGEHLKLYYMAGVDNNYALNNEKSYATFEIDVVGTNDTPTIVANQTLASDGVVEDQAMNGIGNIVADGHRHLHRRRPHRYAHGLLCPENLRTPAPTFRDLPKASARGWPTLGTFALASVSEVPADANNDGSVGWTFTLNHNNDATLQSLALGQTITQVYTVTIIGRPQRRHSDPGCDHHHHRHQ